MKRQSKAEEALAGQVKALQARIRIEYDLMENQKVRIVTLEKVVQELEREIENLRAARQRASESRKP